MICPSCRTAGTALQLGYRESAVRELHSRCPAVSGDRTQCDCQHQTESYITQEAKSVLP